MNKKYIFGGVIVGAFLILMGVLFTQKNISYETDFHNIKVSKTVKVAGFPVKEKDYIHEPDKKTFTFFIKDEKGTELKVVYHGGIPNNFNHATSVVCTGKFENGAFQAKDILTKCPSKYEEEKKRSS